MFICLVTLKEKDNIIQYSIVTNEEEADFDRIPIRVHISTPIADCVMKAIADERQAFVCNNVSYTILKVSLNSEFEKFNPYYRRRVDFTDIKNPAKIYIYKTKAHCVKCRRDGFENNIEYALAEISPILNINKRCMIEVQYCKRCKIYFVDEESLKIFEKKYGTLLFERIFEKHGLGETWWGYEYSGDTVLSRYGYTAKENALSQKERQYILSYIIENNLGTKSELKSILNSFIQLRGGRCYKALPIWKEDLRFLNEYNSSDNRFIGYSTLTRKSKS